MKPLKSFSERVEDIFPSKLSSNELLMALGIAIIREQEELYDAAAKDLGLLIGERPNNYKEAAASRVKSIRDLIELVLQASIVTMRIHLVEKIFAFSKENIFRFAIPDTVLKHALS